MSCKSCLVTSVIDFLAEAGEVAFVLDAWSRGDLLWELFNEIFIAFSFCTDFSCSFSSCSSSSLSSWSASDCISWLFKSSIAFRSGGGEVIWIVSWKAEASLATGTSSSSSSGSSISGSCCCSSDDDDDNEEAVFSLMSKSGISVVNLLTLLLLVLALVCSAICLKMSA